MAVRDARGDAVKAGDRVVVVSPISFFKGLRGTVTRVALLESSMHVRIEGCLTKFLFGPDEVVLETRQHGGDA